MKTIKFFIQLSTKIILNWKLLRICKVILRESFNLFLQNKSIKTNCKLCSIIGTKENNKYENNCLKVINQLKRFNLFYPKIYE